MLSWCHNWVYMSAQSAESTLAFPHYKMELGVVVLGSPRTVLALFTLAQFLLQVRNAPFLCNLTLSSRFLLNLDGSLLSKPAAYQLRQGHVPRPCQVSHTHSGVNGEGGVFWEVWGPTVSFQYYCTDSQGMNQYCNKLHHSLFFLRVLWINYSSKNCQLNSVNMMFLWHHYEPISEGRFYESLSPQSCSNVLKLFPSLHFLVAHKGSLFPMKEFNMTLALLGFGYFSLS